MQVIALLGPTASGKTDLSLQVAQKLNAVILSLDSLSVYKHIDIISAKPSKEERDAIKHFGIDVVAPDENFTAFDFMHCYQKTKQYAQNNNKNIIIAGGSGFYLKALLDGLSHSVSICQSSKDKAQQKTKNLKDAYAFINNYDTLYAKNIAKTDRYRIEKWFEIYYQFGIVATKYFAQNPPEKCKDSIHVFCIDISKEDLYKRITLRTQQMLDKGAIDEAAYLEYTYSRNAKSLQSIGIQEIFDYFDGVIDKKELPTMITNNTLKLAKRQKTFNKTQFYNITALPFPVNPKRVLAYL